MSEVKRTYWCECIFQLIDFFKNVDKAKGILSWSIEKKYTKVTSGAEIALKDAFQNINNSIDRCKWYPEGYQEALQKLSDAKRADPKTALDMVGSAESTFRYGLSKQCQLDRKLMYDEIRPQMDRDMQDWRKMRESMRR